MADVEAPEQSSSSTQAQVVSDPRPRSAQDNAISHSQNSGPKDPNDPENWPEWHKRTTYYTICLFSFMANVNASNFTVATMALRKYFNIDATHAVYLTALNVLMFGMGNLLWIPMMRVTGKRPVYLLAILVLIFSNVWSAKAGSYSSLLASRMFSGIGASAADATVPSAVAEMYNTDIRGRVMMTFHMALASGIFLGPLINAYVVQEHGWRWSPAWIAMASGVVFVLAFFLIHETQYERAPGSKTSQYGPRKPFTWYLSLRRGFTQEHPGKKAWQALKDIVVIASFPPILFASSVVGVFVGWTIIIQVSLSSTYLQPPYSWSLAQSGLLHLAGWLGALSSLHFGGWLIDLLVLTKEERKQKANDNRRRKEEEKKAKEEKKQRKKQAKEERAKEGLSKPSMPDNQDGGVQPTMELTVPHDNDNSSNSTIRGDNETLLKSTTPQDNQEKQRLDKKPDLPERRLPALIIPILIAPVGLILYGFCLAQDRSWIGPAFGYAMHSFGFVAVSNIVVTYAVDNYKVVSGEAMVPLFIVRNAIAVICSMYCFLWIQRDGLKVVFAIMAGLQVAVMLTAIPLYLFSGRIRNFTASYGPMRRQKEKEEKEKVDAVHRDI